MTKQEHVGKADLLIGQEIFGYPDYRVDGA